ncbi:MAG TPA: hypothetical protein VG496_06265 [Myxococcales bacterium]|nr:hypothetical protein [Myxococcales bacterium]
MRAVASVSVFVVAAACSSGTLNPSSGAADQAAVESQLTAQMSQAGVQCAPHSPPECVQACSGKSAGAACSVTHEDDTFNGLCRSLSDGTLACAPPAAPAPPQAAIDACTGKAAGDACQLGADGNVAGTCRDFDSNVLACVPNHLMPPIPKPFPPPEPVQACASKKAGDSCSFTIANVTVNGMCRQFGDGDGDPGDVLACVPPFVMPPPGPPAQACASKAAGDACTITIDGKTLNGVCHQLPDSGPSLCLPPPPQPPQQTLEACAGHSQGDACSVTFREHTITGACEPLPDGSALACAPICRHD